MNFKRPRLVEAPDARMLLEFLSRFDKFPFVCGLLGALELYSYIYFGSGPTSVRESSSSINRMIACASSEKPLRLITKTAPACTFSRLKYILGSLDR